MAGVRLSVMAQGVCCAGKVSKVLKVLMGITFRVLSGLREARLVQSQGEVQPAGRESRSGGRGATSGLPDPLYGKRRREPHRAPER
jgi:hypothetical protein